MCRLMSLLTFCLLALAQGNSAFGDDYTDCGANCDSEYSDCTNAAPDPEPEVQAAKLATCDQRLQSCRANCENLKPIKVPPGSEYNPNVIQK